MSTMLNFGRDVQGLNSYATQFPTDIYTATLAANTPTSVTVPSNFRTWQMSTGVQPGGEVWVARNSTATIPSGMTLTSSHSEINPGTRIVYAGDVISIITPNTTCDVEISFYAISS